MDEIVAGNRYIAEPGLIIVPSVTVADMEAAIQRLWLEGYFKSFKATPIKPSQVLHMSDVSDTEESG